MKKIKYHKKIEDMKKFLLIAVLVMIGSYITAQTTTENTAYSGTTFRMQTIGNHLAYNGVRLSDGNKVLLLGEDVAGQYDKARKHAVMGDAFIVTGSALTAIGVIAVLVEKNLGTDNEIPEDVHSLLKIGGYVVGGVGVAMLPVGIVFRVKGVKAMDRIANDFNSQHGVASTIKFSPSIMSCNAPGMRNQCVVGATMSLNF